MQIRVKTTMTFNDYQFMPWSKAVLSNTSCRARHIRELMQLAFPLTFELKTDSQYDGAKTAR